jgi:hypothetical protein
MFDECMRYNLTVNQNACIVENLSELFPYALVFILGFGVGAIFAVYCLRVGGE